MWSIEAATNAGISHSDMGDQLFFCSGNEEFADFGPYFSSPHVNVISFNDASRAKARITTLLRLVSGIKVLQGSSLIVPKANTLYFERDDGRFEKLHPQPDMETIFEELTNPFDSNVLTEIKYKYDKMTPNRIKDYLQLTVSDNLVREVILLLSLGEEQALYFLINTYKIVENMISDLNLNKNNGKLKPKSPSELPNYLLESMNEIFKYSQYINSRDGSGFLSRHGATNIKAPKHIPTFTEIRSALLLSVNDWLNYKCYRYFG